MYDDYEETHLEKLLNPVFDYVYELEKKIEKLECKLDEHILSITATTEILNREVKRFSCRCGEKKLDVYTDTGEEVPINDFSKQFYKNLEKMEPFMKMFPKKPFTSIDK